MPSTDLADRLAIAGVALLAIAAAWGIHPALGLAVVGGFSVVGGVLLGRRQEPE